MCSVGAEAHRVVALCPAVAFRGRLAPSSHLHTFELLLPSVGVNCTTNVMIISNHSRESKELLTFKCEHIHVTVCQPSAVT